MKKRTYTRGKFFSTVGKGAVLAIIPSIFPIKKLMTKQQSTKININIHPSAVKRENKV